MVPSHRDALRRNYVSLENDLEPRYVMDKLVEDDILSENDCERINKGESRRIRCQLLLSILPTRGRSAFDCFLKALVFAKYCHLEQTLAEYVSTHQHNENLEDTQDGHCNSCRSFLPYFDKHSKLSELFQRCCCILIDNLDPIDILSYHIQECILDENECEHIRQGKTRKTRCKLFLWYLAKSTSNNILSVLTMSLKKKYKFIAVRLERYISFMETAPHEDTRSKRKNTETTCVTFQSRNLDLFKNKRGITATGNKRAFPSGSDDSCSETSNLLSTTKKKQHLLSVDSQRTDMAVSLTKPYSFSSNEEKIRYIQDTFDCLSCLINQGKYIIFENYSSRLSERHASDPNMMCLLEYLKASRDLFRIDLTEAKKHIKRALQLAPKTSNPQYSQLELLTAKTRMYLIQKKLGKLQSVLVDAKMIIETDNVGYGGRAAGWLYVNDGRSYTVRIGMTQFRNQKSIDTYRLLHNNARRSFETALMHFQQEEGRDSPFGLGFTLCQLVVLLLRCGENGMTMEILSPPKEDEILAEKYIHYLSNGKIPMTNIIRVYYRIAKCDYHFRKANTSKAIKNAEKAHRLATDLNLLECVQNAHNRLLILRTKTPLSIKEIDEETLAATLFGNISESEQ